MVLSKLFVYDQFSYDFEKSLTH